MNLYDVTGELARLRAALAERDGEVEQLRAELERVGKVAAVRAGADPGVRDVLLWEFGTTEPDLIREACQERRRTVAQLKADHAAEIAEFNAGYQAARDGLGEDAEPEHTPHDVWRCGYAWGRFEGLKAENATLRAQNLAHAGRIAAQSDALGRAAERDVIGRLEAWRSRHQSRNALIGAGSAAYSWWVRLTNGSSVVHINGYRQAAEPDGAERRDGVTLRPFIFWIGEPNQPATLAQCVDAALREWQQRYPEKTP